MTASDDPCRICGSPAHVRHVEGDKRLLDKFPRLVEKRVCTNPRCDSNTGYDPRLGKVV